MHKIRSKMARIIVIHKNLLHPNEEEAIVIWILRTQEEVGGTEKYKADCDQRDSYNKIEDVTKG